jgi:hypothetical protein
MSDERATEGRSLAASGGLSEDAGVAQWQTGRPARDREANP